MSPDAWSNGADELLRGVLAELEQGAPDYHARVRAALDAGGRLKLVIDKPDQAWRLRVRLVHGADSDQANYWVWESYAPCRP